MVAGLIYNRHKLPDHVKSFVWDFSMTSEEILDVAYQEQYSVEWLRENVGENETLNLYVTGLTQALVAMINACHLLGVPLILWHYDRESQNYYKQIIL